MFLTCHEMNNCISLWCNRNGWLVVTKPNDLHIYLVLFCSSWPWVTVPMLFYLVLFCSSWPSVTMPMLWGPWLAQMSLVLSTTFLSCPCCKLLWPSTVLERLQPAVFCLVASCWRLVSSLCIACLVCIQWLAVWLTLPLTFWLGVLLCFVF